jgi:hypothetical protein
MIPGWLDELEDEVARALPGEGSVSLGTLAAALGVSERCATSYVALLASAGRLTIERVSVPTRRRGEFGREVVAAWGRPGAGERPAA